MPTKPLEISFTITAEQLASSKADASKNPIKIKIAQKIAAVSPPASAPPSPPVSPPATPPVSAPPAASPTGGFDVIYLALPKDDDQPYANLKYELWIKGSKFGEEERRTTDEGIIHVEVPKGSGKVELKVWYDGDDNEPDLFTLEPGALDPIDTIEGVQDRLNNLGFDTGDEREIGPKTQAAIKAFQESVDLIPTGELNTQTKNSLSEENDINLNE